MPVEVTPFADRHGLGGVAQAQAAMLDEVRASVFDAVRKALRANAVSTAETNAIARALRGVYERINMMVTTDPVSDALAAVRAEADGWGVTLNLASPGAAD